VAAGSPRNESHSAGPASVRNAARQNRLLAALPECDLARWLPRLRPVKLESGQVVQDVDGKFRDAIFPTTAVVGLRLGAADPSGTEIGMVGNEGVVGLPHLEAAGPVRAVVQQAGWGFALVGLAPGADADADTDGEAVTRLLLRYSQALFAQVAHAAVCARHHSIEQQMCRWLLLTLDRVDSTELAATQAELARRLGARRGEISACAGALRHAGLIDYARGVIAVHNRRGLEQRACACYASITREYDRLLPTACADAVVSKRARGGRVDEASGVAEARTPATSKP
jgi:Crp-like helix-turn-helix domain